MILSRSANRQKGQGLAEIIVICVIVLFISLVAVRVLKKKQEIPADLNPALNSTPDQIPTSASPHEIIEGAKEKMEQTQRTIPEDLREDNGDKDDGDEE
jgi:cell division protein FtsN